MVKWARYPGGLIWHILLEETDYQSLQHRAWALCVHALWQPPGELEILEGQTPIDTTSQIRCPVCDRLLQELKDDE